MTKSILPVNILTLSADTLEELNDLIEKYKHFLREEGATLDLSNVAYSTNNALSSKSHHRYRFAVTGGTIPEILNKLEKSHFEKGVVHENDQVSGKLCFLFSGNGGCFHRMAQSLYETVPYFRAEFDEWASFIEKSSKISLHDTLFGTDASIVENDPVLACLSLELINYLLSSLWKNWGIEPDCVLGHSLGEYGATPCAGILSVKDSLMVLLRFAECGGTNILPPGKMAVVLANEKTLETVVSQSLIKKDEDEWLSIAGKNAQTNHVVAGCPASISKFMELCKNNAIKTVPLQVPVAYHSKGVDCIVDLMNEAGCVLDYHEPTCEYISCLTGKVLKIMPTDYWGKHVRLPFKFSEACSTAYKDCGARVFLEMGGQPHLSALMLQNVYEMGEKDEIICLQSMKKGKHDLDIMLDSLAKLYVLGYDVNWENFYKDFDVDRISVPICDGNEHSFINGNLSEISQFLIDDQDMNEDIFWKRLNQCHNNDIEKQELILSYVFQVMRRVLKMDDISLDPEQEFRSSGIDSLLAIQMKSHIQKILGSQVSLGFNDLIECYTPIQLVEKLNHLILNSSNNNNNNNNGIKSKKASKEALKQLVKEDSVLWSHIRGHKKRPVPLTEIKTVLISGATGNLAPYILLELANRPQTQKIYCIVREGKNLSVQKRLENHLKEQGIWDKIQDHSKIIAVKGNIVDEFMGMEESKYEKLTQEVDAIFNCAVTSNHLAPYKKEDIKYGGVRAVNVIGVQRMLEFASTKRTKWVYHASTFLALWGKTGVHYDRCPETWPNGYVDELDNFPNFGYAISKIIADDLIHQATQKGIPGKSFRFTKIGGDTETGKQKVVQNHFFCKFLHYIDRGLMPNLDVPLQVMPVDTCAKISVSIFFDPRTNPSDIYNLIAPYNCNEMDEIVDLTEEFGPQIRILTQLSRIVEKYGEDGARQKWLEMTSTSSSPSNPLAKVATELDRTIGVNWYENPSSAFSNDYVMDFIRSQVDCNVDIVPYDEYTKHLIQDGENSLVYHWIDFYCDEESLFYIADKGKLPLQDSWKRNQSHFLRWGKIEMLYSNLHELIEHPKETLRRDIQYTINNAKDIFKNRFNKQ